MDFTKEYIAMCEKAGEIQPHKIDDGDMYYWSVDKRCHLAYTEHYPEYNVKHPEQWDYLHGRKVIWLPRQDQLQEMVRQEHEFRNGYSWQVNFIRDFNSWIQRTVEGLFKITITAEQLALMYVMQLKYHKFWNGKDWEEMK